MNSVSKKIGQSLLFISTAEGIWQNLMSRFKQDDAPRVYEIEQRLSVIQQGSQDVSSYYTELVTLWEEYRNYVELPICTCGKCECNAAALWEKLQQRSRVTKFLMGLNESYESTRRHILMLKPIPNIEDAFNMVAQDERQKNIKPAFKPDNVVFQNSAPTAPIASYAASYQVPMENVAYAIQNNYRPRPPRPICTHCGQSGHVVQKCFKKHGYPPGYIPGFKSTLSNYNAQRSVTPPVTFQPRGQVQALPRSYSVANVMTGPPSYIPPPATNATSLDVSQYNNDQIQTLIQQLTAHVQSSEPAAPSPLVASVIEHGIMAAESSSGNPSFPSTSLRFENNRLTFQHQCLSTLYTHLPHGSWIIDTGATSHVCSDLSFFSETTIVSGVTVSLPNDSRVDIAHTGTFQLSKSLILNDVLHVPSFKFNLISVSSLLKSNHCSAHFYIDSCIIQEFTQGLTIGRGNL